MDVAFFYSMEKNTFMCTFGGMHYPLDYTLDHLDEILDPEHYFRINRQTIVHFGAITRMSLMPKSRIKLHTTPEAPNELMVSTARTPGFRKWLDK
jgi:two-component system, LytTR family, response regulator LytT